MSSGALGSWDSLGVIATIVGVTATIIVPVSIVIFNKRQRENPVIECKPVRADWHPFIDIHVTYRNKLDRQVLLQYVDLEYPSHGKISVKTQPDPNGDIFIPVTPETWRASLIRNVAPKSAVTFRIFVMPPSGTTLRRIAFSFYVDKQDGRRLPSRYCRKVRI